jgi:hypothetical protein
MAFVHGKDGKVMMNYASVSADIRQWSAMFKRNYADTTALQDGGVKNILGHHEGTISAQGHFDSSASRLIQIITDAANAGAANLVNTDNGMNVTILPEGDAIGSPAIFGACDIEEFEVESEVDDAVKVSFEGMADNMVDMGVSLHALGAESADANHTSVDNLASTANGGAAMLHVTSVSASDSIIVKVQHSVDDAVWADLITFTSFTAVGSERKELAAGTTVNRYVRAVTDVTGASVSISYQMSFARR